jgi:hypothetical protein
MSWVKDISHRHSELRLCDRVIANDYLSQKNFDQEIVTEKTGKSEDVTGHLELNDHH